MVFPRMMHVCKDGVRSLFRWYWAKIRAPQAAHLRACLEQRPQGSLGGGQPELRLLGYEHGRKQEQFLARCHPHGDWIAWLDSA